MQTKWSQHPQTIGGDRAEIIDGDHGPEPDVETRTQPGGNSEGHTRVKPSKESRDLRPDRNLQWHKDQDK